MEIKKVRRKKKAARVLTWVSAAVILACMAGLLIGLVMMGTGGDSAWRDSLFLILCGGCLAGLLLAALASVGLYRLSEKYEAQESDLRELAVSERSFFAGDKLLATFDEQGVRFHAEEGNERYAKTDIRVPYAEMKVYSVVTRRSPKAKGEAIVLLEIPSRFFAAKKEKQNESQPALIRLDGKERLMATLDRFGVERFGLRHGEEPTCPFKAAFCVSVPEKQKRDRAVMGVAGGVFAIVAGVVLAFLVNSSAGIAIACLGVMFAVHSTYAAATAKNVFAVSETGFYWKDVNRYDRMFLYADEVGKIRTAEQEGRTFVEFDCLYASYYFPDVGGLYERLCGMFPDKCEEER